MNGIIHHCSHPNDVDAHHRISDEKIFIDIFNYIDHLFTKIKPKKLFFMAVDGKQFSPFFFFFFLPQD